MNIIKRSLSVLLTLCMLVGMLVPSAFAADTSRDTSTSSTITHMSTKPTDGTTTGNPFIKGTAGSNSFRIPALVTLSDGTLVAAADARWNTTYDGGCGDTIVSRSSDGGENWSYTFANYLGDNGNTYNGSSSTCFIDPALAVTSNDTIYMLVDLYPYGVALNGNHTAPSTEVGFNDAGKLKLSTDGKNYSYYLDGDTIYSSSGTAVSGYTVDDHFNVFENGTYKSNLFFSDSPFKVVRTGYLYLTKSTDKGATWSAPTLLNNIKTSSERVCLVAPGRGLVTSGGMIVFPVYSYNCDVNAGSVSNVVQKMSFIYSTNNGETWTRSTSFTGKNWSSESAVVELSDGTLRFFYRNGTSKLCYVDYANGSWGSAVSTGVATNSNTQLSAISYSKTVGGNQVILVSCPTGENSNGSADSSGSARLNGKIFVFTVENDKTLKHCDSVSVDSKNNSTTNYFMYSCLTEKGGKVAILYEDNESNWGTGSNSYYQMSFNANAVDFDKLDIAFDAETPTPDTDVGNGGSNGSNGDLGSNGTDAVLPDNGASDTTLPDNYKTADAEETSSDAWTLVENGVSGIVSGDEYLIANSKADGTVYLLKNDGTTNGDYKVDASVGSVTPKIKVAVDGSCVFTITVKESTGENSYTILGSDKEYLYTDATYSSGFLGLGRGWTYKLTTGSNAEELKIDENSTAATYSFKIYRTITSNGESTNSYINFSSSKFGADNSGSALYLYAKSSIPTYTISIDKFNALLGNVPTEQGNYTTETWSTFEAEYEAAKAFESTETTYSTADEAAAAVEKLNGAAQALYSAWQGLKEYSYYDIKINYTCDGNVVKTETKNVREDETTLTLDTTVTVGENNYSVNNKTLTITPKTQNVYSVPVTLIEGTPIPIKERETEEISVTLTDGQYVEWSSADATYVGVAGKYDATAKGYTNAAVIMGYNVTDGTPILVTGTVYNSDGTVAGVEKWLVTVIAGDEDTNTSSRYIYVNIEKIENCTVYYSINGGELKKVNGTGVLIDGKKEGHFNIMYFAAPDDGYALTAMTASNTNGDYYTLSNGNPDGTGSDAWPFNSETQSVIPSNSSDSAWKKNDDNKPHGFCWSLLEGNMTIEQMKLLFSSAIALGCDGATTQTKNAQGTTNKDESNSNNLVTNLSFIAEKLPELHKKLTGVTRDDKYSPYSDGMTVSVGDTLHYTLYVSVPKMANSESNSIAYSTFELDDSLTTAKWTASSIKSETAATSFKFGTATKSVTSTTLDAYASAIETAAKANGSVDGFTNDSFTYTDSNGDTKTYSASTSNIYAFHTDLKVTESNFTKVVDEHGNIENEASLGYKYKANYSSGSKTVNSKAVVTVKLETLEYVIDFGLPVTIPTSVTILDSTSAATAKATAKFGDAEVNDDGSITYTPNQILTDTDFITITYGNGYGYGVRIYPATTVYYEESFLTGSESWEKGGTAVSGEQTATELGKENVNYGYDSAYNDGDSSYITSSDGGTASFTFKGTGFKLYANSNKSSGYVTVYSKGNLSKLYMIDTHLEGGETGATNGQNTDDTYYGLPIISETALKYGEYTVQLKQKGEGHIDITGIMIIGTLQDSPVYEADLEDDPEFHELRDHVLNSMEVEKVNTSDYISSNNRDGLVSKVEELAGQVYNAAEGESSAIVVTPKGVLTSDNAQDLLDNGPKNELYLYAGQTLTFKVTTDRIMQLGMKAPTGNAKFTVKVGDDYLDTTSITSPVEMFYKLNSKPSASTEYTVIVNVSDGMLSVTDLKICDDPNATFTALSAEDIEQALYVAYGVEDFVAASSATVTVKYVSIFGKQLGTATVTKYFDDEKYIVISASELRSSAPAGKRALWFVPIIVRPNDDVTVTVPVI